MRGKGISAVIAVLFLLVFIKPTFAWWDSGWQYRVSATIDNTGNSNTLTDYQVMITLDTASLISAGKMNSDCGDIRVVDSNDATALSFWIEDGTCNTAETHIWVKVPSIPASSTYTIYIYYGNSRAASASSIDNTFIFGDDFNGNSLDTSKWVVSGNGKYSINNGYIEVKSGTGSGWQKTVIYHENVLTNNYIVQSKIKVKQFSDKTYKMGLIILTTSGDEICGSTGCIYSGSRRDKCSGIMTRWGDGAISCSSVGISTNVWYSISIKGYGTSSYPNNWIAVANDNEYGSWSSSDSVVNVGLKVQDNSPATDMIMDYDYIFVRKYTNPEPTTSVGTEESNAGGNTPPTAPTDISFDDTGYYVGDTITATASGSTDAEGDTITYYYKFNDVTAGTTLQAYSTTNTYTITTSEAHHEIRVCSKAYDGTDYSSEYCEDIPQTYVLNSIPTAPTDITFDSSSYYVGDTITATGSGSADNDGDSLTYYYKYYDVDTSTILQDWSTSNTYTITTSEAHHTIRVYTKTYDGYDYSGEYYEDISVLNSVPTAPTDIVFDKSEYHVGDTITATASGSTDNDGDSLTYYYQFYDVNTSTILQVYSTTNTYTTTTSDANHEIAVYVKAYDGYDYSAEYSESVFVQSAVPQIEITSPTASTYYGITSQTFTFKVTDADTSTLTVRAYLDGNLIYENTAYTNGTQISLSKSINVGKEYNFSVYAMDGITPTSSDVIFHVWYGVNITANTNTFDITININEINTTYSDVSYKEIEWTEVGNNSYADIWVTQEGYDMDYRRVYFNDTMGVVNVQMTIYTVHTFYMYDTKNNKYIKTFNLLVKNTQLEKQYGTTTGVIKVSTREIPDGIYALNATAFGYNYVELNMNLNNSYILNYTFDTTSNSFEIQVYDEKNNTVIESAEFKFYLSNAVWEYKKNKTFISYETNGYDGWNPDVYGPSNSIDGDLSTYTTIEDNHAGGYGSATFYYYIGGWKNRKGKMCVKYKLDNLEPSHSPYALIYVYLYNYTSGSYVSVYSKENINNNLLETACFEYDNTNNDFGSVFKVKVYVKENDYANWYIYEVYPEEYIDKDAPLILSAAELDNNQIMISLTAEDYALRRYYITPSAYSSITLNAYLLKTADGSNVGITVKNKRGIALPDVLITVLKYINGAWVSVEQEKTDDSGTTTLFLKTTDIYKIKLEKNGYVTLYKTLIPTSSQYTFYMSDEIALNFNSILEGISLSLTPMATAITTINTTISYVVSSYYNDLEFFGMDVYAPNRSLMYSKAISTSPSGGEINYTINLNNIQYETGDTILVSTYFKKADTNEVEYSTYYLNRTYTIWYYEGGNATLINAIEVMDEENTYSFIKLIISVVIMLVSVVGVAVISPYLSVIALLIELAIFTSIGFITPLIASLTALFGIVILILALKG